MKGLTEWADARLARVLDGADVNAAVDERLPAVDGTDAFGRLRVWHGDVTIVDSRLTMPSQGIDSVMLHAFAAPHTTAPHLLSDLAVMPDGRWHFHVDLMPRVDVVASPDYLDAVYAPLTPHVEQAYAIDECAPIPIPLRLRALSSPWLIGVIAPERAEPTLTAVHDAYVDRWHHLVRTPPAVDAQPDPSALVARDVQHRSALFDDATDPVWGFVAAIIGESAAQLLLRTVRGTT